MTTRRPTHYRNRHRSSSISGCINRPTLSNENRLPSRGRSSRCRSRSHPGYPFFVRHFQVFKLVLQWNFQQPTLQPVNQEIHQRDSAQHRSNDEQHPTLHAQQGEPHPPYFQFQTTHFTHPYHQFQTTDLIQPYHSYHQSQATYPETIPNYPPSLQRITTSIQPKPGLHHQASFPTPRSRALFPKAPIPTSTPSPTNHLPGNLPWHPPQKTIPSQIPGFHVHKHGIPRSQQSTQEPLQPPHHTTNSNHAPPQYLQTQPTKTYKLSQPKSSQPQSPPHQLQPQEPSHKTK